jgi:hypothetical protein
MAEELEGPGIFSFNLTVETPIDIDDMIYMLSPIDLPLLHGINADGMAILPRKPLSQVSFDWLEEEVPLPRGTLNEALDASEPGIDLVTGDAVKFAVGDGIRIDDEIMIVTDIDTTTETLTVTRGSAAETNTTAATHATGAEVIGLGTILIEGAVGNANYQGRDKYSNYAQIWTKKINMSATEQLIRKYGVPSELSHQMINAMQHMSQGIEQSALYGVKHRHATTFRRQTGGLDYFITSSEDTTSDWITINEVEERQQTAYDNGGSFNILMGRPSVFRALNNLAGTERIQTVTIDDSRRGRRRATTVMTEFGDVTLVRNRWVKATEAFGFSRENFTYRVLRPMQTVKLAKTDDTDTYMMVCEGGFQVKGQDHMTKFTGLDTSAAFPVDLV